MPDAPKTPQFNLRMDEDLRKKAVAIARVRGERDLTGAGYAAVVRKFTEGYVKRHIAQLPEDWDKG